jgi:HEAT repeat protein
VDIMSDPAVDKEDASEVGHLLTAALVRENILEISTVFQDDMIKLGLKLPWRVEMAIQRLAKDLRTVPMFQNLSADELSKLKARIIEDILRPLREPHLLKEMVVNCYLIARQVEGLKAEELEQTLIEHFPMAILLPTSEFVFAEMKALQAELDQKPDSLPLQERLGGIKRILKVISERVLKEEVAGGEAFLENLFFQEVLRLDELPPAVQDRINTLRLAQAFAQNPAYYAGKFAECRAPEDYRLFLRFWRRILPEILDNRDYPNLYFLCAALHDAKKRDPEQLARLRGEVKDEVEHVWASHYANLKEIFLTEKKETRAGLDEVVIMLGASGLELMVQVLSESKDRWVRKGAIDALIRMGAPARKHIRAILDDPGQPWALQRSALFILSQLALPPAGAPPAGAEPAAEKEDQARFERFLSHSQPQLREEAAVSLFRLLGPRAVPKLTAAMDDPDPRVRRRALACLAALPTLPADLAGRVASHLRPEEGKTEEDMVKVQAAKVLAQLGNVPVNADEDAEAVLLSLLGAGAGWAKKLLSKFREETGESEAVKLVALDTLGKIGTEKSLSLLERLAKTAAGQLLAKIQETQKQIELRTQK